MCNSPCLGCTERKVGCHSVCNKYADWKVANNEEAKWLKAKNAHYWAAIRRVNTVYGDYETKKRFGVYK